MLWGTHGCWLMGQDWRSSCKTLKLALPDLSYWGLYTRHHPQGAQMSWCFCSYAGCCLPTFSTLKLYRAKATLILLNKHAFHLSFYAFRTWFHCSTLYWEGFLSSEVSFLHCRTLRNMCWVDDDRWLDRSMFHHIAFNMCFDWKFRVHKTMIFMLCSITSYV